MEPLTLTVIDAARALGISRTKAYAMARSGELPTLRIGRAVRVPIAELRAWIASQARLQQNRSTPADDVRRDRKVPMNRLPGEAR